ncbi:uncharacterized protein LOC143371109 isoform X2 [Andrena cerasifolii]|uniref:uncharacterized protein LOC143371109 isoform X2 n=1 Tax=Andrena cerasifolii TaxID=2819439 RepID=UPI004037AF4D
MGKNFCGSVYLKMEKLLIEKVRGHEVLYNHRSSDYRDQYIRQAAWEEIGRELKIPGNKAKECWDKLRRCFCNAKNRRRDDTKNGTASKKKSCWKYEQQMSFIIPFLESRKTHGKLNRSQTSVNLATEPEGVSEKSKAELRHIDLDTESELGIQDNQAADDEAAFNDAGTIETRYEAMKLLHNKKQKQQIDTPAQQMVHILEESSAVRKRPYEEGSMRPKTSKTTSLLETLDDTDMFFLSMSRMTKQLPKVEQSQIKLALSNSVLLAEVKCNEQSLPSTPHPQHSFHRNPIQQQSFSSSPSPAPNKPCLKYLQVFDYLILTSRKQLIFLRY